LNLNLLLFMTATNPPSDARKPATHPDTPCVAVCSTTFDDVCRGCGRTVAEVANWVFMTDEEKEVVWQRITAEGYPRRQG
jgi:predicted Fe-S protein YdhL (DUF1289 family)